jgi:Lipocalin-like domain
MQIVARGVVARVASLVMLAWLAAPSLAATPGKSIKDQLVGHWQLVSISINDMAPYGAHPQGSMFFDADGHYSVIVITGGAAKSISYFGTYTVDDAAKSMTMHIQASNHGHADGRDAKRLVSFNGDELTVESERKSTRFPGSIKLIWKRAD